MKLIKGAILFIIYFLIDSSLLNEDYNLQNKIYNNKSVICNNIFLNITPIKNNIIENCQCIYNYKIKKQINVYNIFFNILNKVIIFLGNSLIIFICVKNNQMKNKMIVLIKV
jgi:hypothetical protein